MVMGEWAIAARNYHDLALEFFVKAIVSTDAGDRENYRRAAQFYAAEAGAELTRARQALDSTLGYGAEDERGNQHAEADTRIVRLEATDEAVLRDTVAAAWHRVTDTTADTMKTADVARASKSPMSERGPPMSVTSMSPAPRPMSPTDLQVY
jgi:hypothetical protein